MPDPFDDYLQQLRSAADLYSSDIVRSRVLAVSAAIQFLRDKNVDRSLVTPLLDLLGHLEDERLGRTGNSNPAIWNANMAAASAVVTLAMNTGKTQKLAAKLVADHVRLDAKVLAQFRKNLLSKRVSAEAQDIYHKLIAASDESDITREHQLTKGLEFIREKMTAASS